MNLATILRVCMLLAVISMTAHAQREEPFPPHRVAGNLYYVGSRDNATYLVTTNSGHVLINSGFDETVPIIRAGVEKLGFKMSDVKILLLSHAHSDHAAGMATLKAATGAKVYVMEGDDKVVASGGEGQYKLTGRWKPCPVDRVLKPGEQVKIGEAVLIAHRTPGHTRGFTTWSMRVSDSGKSYNAVIIGSPNVLDGYRLKGDKDYPEIADDFARGFRLLKSLECDIFLGAHGNYYDMEAKLARVGKTGVANPFVDPAGCRAFIEDREQRYLKLLATEQK